MARHIGKTTQAVMEFLAQLGEIFVDPAYRSVNGYLAMSMLTPEERKSRRAKSHYYQTFRRLGQSRLIIKREKPDGTVVVSLTEHGKRKIREFRFWDLKILVPRRWDGKYRLVVFDIPKAYGSKKRNAFTRKLTELGLYPFQKSVWVFPYPCAPEIEFLAEYIGLGRYVHIVEAQSITNDASIQKNFRL